MMKNEMSLLPLLLIPLAYFIGGLIIYLAISRYYDRDNRRSRPSTIIGAIMESVVPNTDYICCRCGSPVWKDENGIFWCMAQSHEPLWQITGPSNHQQDGE